MRDSEAEKVRRKRGEGRTKAVRGETQEGRRPPSRTKGDPLYTFPSIRRYDDKCKTPEAYTVMTSGVSVRHWA